MTITNDTTKELTDLRALPDGEQREVMGMILGEKVVKPWQETVEKLAPGGVITTEEKLKEFASWWRLREQFRSLERDTNTLKQLLRERNPEITEPDLEKYANAFFQMRALQMEDATTFTRLVAARIQAESEPRKLKLREEQARLQREKFEFSAAEACLKELPALREIANDSEIDVNEKIDRIRRRLFGDAADLVITMNPGMADRE